MALELNFRNDSSRKAEIAAMQKYRLTEKGKALKKQLKK
jgi:hypothetical protein